jgi:hypothetical protein
MTMGNNERDRPELDLVDAERVDGRVEFVADRDIAVADVRFVRLLDGPQSELFLQGLGCREQAAYRRRHVFGRGTTPLLYHE